MLEQVETIIARTLNVENDVIMDDLAYQAIAEWDSMQHMRLMLALGNAFQIDIGPDDVLELTNVASIKEFITRSKSMALGATPADVADARAQIGRESVSDLQGLGSSRPPQNEQEVRPAQSSDAEEIRIARGLNGIYLDNTTISHIDGQAGELYFRGYSIHELAEHSTFEETAYLLLYGELPSQAQLRAFSAELIASRDIPQTVVEIIRAVRNAHPMDALRTAVSALATFDPEREEASPEATLRRGIRLLGQMGTMVATHHRLRLGQEPVAPDPALSYAANFLYMLSGERASERATRIIDKDLVLHSEHGSNASAFVARTVTGTRADLHAAVTSAIAAFAGSLHGGAAEDVMKMLEEIGEPEAAFAYVQRLVSNNTPVMGFGHRVYRVEDPRARHLRGAARELSEELGQTKWIAILDAVTDAMRDFFRYGMNINVDFYTGVAYHLLGIPRDLFVPIFVISRTAGWVAHVIEQQTNNILIRPLLHYAGENGRQYTAMAQRG
jgi:citrate synthase